MARQSEVTHPNRAAFPPGLSGPALRALNAAGIRSVVDLAGWTVAELSARHGIGPKALELLQAALRQSGDHFRMDPPAA